MAGNFFPGSCDAVILTLFQMTPRVFFVNAGINVALSTQLLLLPTL
jgi:hypothetical protein